MRIIHIRLQSIGKIVFNCCTYVFRLNSHFWHNIFLLTKIKKIFPLTCIFPLMWKYVRTLFYYFVRWIGVNYYFFTDILNLLIKYKKKKKELRSCYCDNLCIDHRTVFWDVIISKTLDLKDLSLNDSDHSTHTYMFDFSFFKIIQ